MAGALKGLTSLLTRFEAIKPNSQMMRTLALEAVAAQKRRAPYKTRNLSRSIGVGKVTATSAETVAKAPYAAAVELGTKPHDIKPRRRKALRFAASAEGARLSGTPRTGADVVFAKRVRHPGTQAQPFMVPGAQEAVDKLGPEMMIKRWNDAG